MAVGPGRRAANGELIEPGVKEGDHVLMPDYGGQEVDLDGTKCAAYPQQPPCKSFVSIDQRGNAPRICRLTAWLGLALCARELTLHLFRSCACLDAAGVAFLTATVWFLAAFTPCKL